MATHYNELLDKFCIEFPCDSSADNEVIPFDIDRRQLTKDEVEGQCMDWIISFLIKR
jgi:hypothetical protein